MSVIAWQRQTCPHLELNIRAMFCAVSLSLSMDKLNLTGQNLGRVFKSRLGRVCIGHELYTCCETIQLKVENSGQTTFRFSPVSF